MKKIKQKVFINNANPFTVDAMGQTLIYLDTSNLHNENCIITFYNLLKGKIINEIVDLNTILINSSDSAIDIDSMNKYLAYINLGCEIKILNLEDNSSFTYIPFNENEMLGNQHHRLQFSKNDKFMIFNSKNNVEIVSLKNLSYLDSITIDNNSSNGELMPFSISDDSKYLAIFFTDYIGVEPFPLIKLINLEKIHILGEYRLDKSLICLDSIFDNTNKNLISFSISSALFHPYIQIINIEPFLSSNIITIECTDEQCNPYTRLVKNPLNGDIFLVSNNLKNKQIYKLNLEDNCINYMLEFETNLSEVITKIVITNDGKYLIISDSSNVEVYEIE